jgi:magnesium and cobalt transporter
LGDPLGYGLGSLAFIASVGLSVVEGAFSDFSWAKLEDIARAKKATEKTARFLKKEDDLALSASSLKVAMNVLFVLMAARVAGAETETVITFVSFGALAGIILIADVPAYLVGRRLSESILVRVLPTMNVVRFLLQPALWTSRFGGEIIARVLGHPDVETQAESIAEDILSAAAEGRQEGVIAEEEQDMIEGIIRFKERQISDVMTPRTDMVCIPVDTPVAEAAKLAMEKGFSRIPVYRETRDNIIGVLFVRDLLEFWGNDGDEPPPLEKIVREPHVTPESKKIPVVFEEMRVKKTHMAVAVDEYGGTSGLITIEDILEEIVGEIEDEYDPEPTEPFRIMDDRTALVDGHLRIDDLNDRFEVAVPEEDGYDTVGGYLCSVFGRVPQRGEMHNLGPVEFTIMDADPRRVRLVQVIKDGHE